MASPSSSSSTLVVTEPVSVGGYPVLPNQGRIPVPARIAKLAADMRLEYVAGGSNAGIAAYARALEWWIDDLTQEFGIDTYERMMLEPCFAGTINGLRASVLSTGFSLRPAVEDRDQDGYDQAVQLHAKYERVLADMETAPEDWLWDLSSACYLGNRVAEITYDDTPKGGRPRLVPAQVKVKPQRAIAFITDPFLNVLGLLGALPGTVGTFTFSPFSAVGQNLEQIPNLIPRIKFLLYSFRPRNNDPRGTSLGHPVWDAWNRLQQLKLSWLLYTAQFGSPSLVGTASPNARSEYLLDANGDTLNGPDGQPISVKPVQALEDALKTFKAGTYIALPNGATVEALSVPEGGALFAAAFADLRNEIIYGITGQTLATSEAQHDTRAASQVHQDQRDVLVLQMRGGLLGAVYRDVIKPMVRFNDGDTLAELAPVPSLGESEAHDFAINANAVALLERAGYLDDSQKPGLDKFLGLDARSEGWMDRAQLARQQRAAASNPFGGAEPQPAQQQQQPPMPFPVRQEAAA